MQKNLYSYYLHIFMPLLQNQMVVATLVRISK
nr:MAG TPA: hypothetical protein [Bacteriophage sp.]